MATQRNTADGLTFGATLSYSSSRKMRYERTDDHKSFMIRFDPAFAASVGKAGVADAPTVRAPIGTRTYAAVIPARGRSVDVALVVNGFVLTQPGTTGLLVLVVNGETQVTRFEAGKDGEAMTASLRYRADAVDGIRIAVLLVAERAADQPGSAAEIAINDISADAALTPARG